MRSRSPFDISTVTFIVFSSLGWVVAAATITGRCGDCQALFCIFVKSLIHLEFLLFVECRRSPVEFDRASRCVLVVSAVSGR
jgi:hypothetical protein